MSAIEAKLKAMGLTLPPPRTFPSPNRRGCVRVGNIIFVSGHGAHHPDMKFREAGKLGADMTVEEGKLLARIAALTILSTVKKEVGDLDRVRRVIRLFGWLIAPPNFPICRRSSTAPRTSSLNCSDRNTAATPGRQLGRSTCLVASQSRSTASSR